jgi:Acetyltransferase (GNAT) domain
MIASYTFEEREEFLAIWSGLADASLESSFFISRPWVSAWLETFGRDLKPELYTLRHLGVERAAWILVRRLERWHGIPVRRVYIGTAGEREADSPCVEYNTIVCHPEFSSVAGSAIAETIRRKSCDEIHFPATGLCEFSEVSNAVDSGVNSMRIVPTYAIDLERIRTAGGQYLAALSHKVRKGVRQAYKAAIEGFGPLVLEEAQTHSQAVEIYEDLAMLHTASWKARDLPGAFASKRFDAFHRRLIDSSFPVGGVSLMRVRAGEKTIACLYNFVHDGTVHFYQSGLGYCDVKNLRPGYIALGLAIQHFADSGLDRFDLMGGNYEYKRALSTESAELVYGKIKMRSISNALISSIRALRS